MVETTPKNKKYEIFSDGGARGNPGEAAYGWLLFDAESGELLKLDASSLGIASNNVAEYQGIINALKKFNYGGSELTCYLDSELIVRQLLGEYKVKNEVLKNLHKAVQSELTRLENEGTSVEFKHIRREFNKHADRLVNICLDEKNRSQ